MHAPKLVSIGRTLYTVRIFKFKTQGNGHERDFLGDDRVYIFDMYNSLIYPRDHGAKAAIRRKVELYHHTSDDVYLEHIRRFITIL